MSLENKTVLITGASRGIGKDIAIEFAKENANVVINYNKSEENAIALKKRIETLGKKGKTHIVKADVSDYEEVKQMFAYIKNQVGQLDILINNAGITRDKLLLLMQEKDWSDVINTNLNSVYYCAKEALRFLANSETGTIINISSVGGIVGSAGQTNYAASKAGILAFTKALAKETARSKITVNAIAPGFIETEMVKKANESMLKKWIETIPLRRLGKGEEVAKLAVFLASDNSRYITGQTIVIDGGVSS